MELPKRVREKLASMLVFDRVQWACTTDDQEKDYQACVDALFIHKKFCVRKKFDGEWVMQFTRIPVSPSVFAGGKESSKEVNLKQYVRGQKA